MTDSILDDFWGRNLGLLIEFPFLMAPPINLDHFLSGYKQGEEGYVWSSVHGICGNAPGYEWLENAPIVWLPTRSMTIPFSFIAALMCLPFVLLLGGICLVGELCGKERGWFV
jgi:hypothetical protein